MKLLIIEDDKDQIQMYMDNIESFNKSKTKNISVIIKENFEDAELALLSPEYDAAIVDLKLSDNIEELEGEEIVKQIEGKLRFPIFIVSGSIGQIDIEENSLIKKRSRDSDFKRILEEIYAIYETGITKILGSKGEIEGRINNIFWEHLANTIHLWVDDKIKTPEQKQKSLSRFVLSHIQEYLELTTESDFEKYHAAEFYITPPIKDKIYTGDIVIEKKTGKRYIVLTPSCDLAQAKAEEVLLAEIEDEDQPFLKSKTEEIKQKKIVLNGKINLLEANKAKLEENKQNKKDLCGIRIEIEKNKVAVKKSESSLRESEKLLRSVISNSNANKYHYLPNYKDICVGLINFQKLKTVEKDDFDKMKDLYERKASVNSSFTKDIIARFSFYYSRQGSPDFDIEEIYESLMAK